MSISAAGCTFVPDYHRPETSPAAAWDTRLPVDDRSIPVHDGWWRDFASPELDRLMADGLTGSFTLQAAIARLHQAEGTAEIDAAPLWPALDLVGTHDQASGVKGSRTHQLLGQATYEIDFWGRNEAAAASGTALAEASGYDAATAAMTLSAAVADGYFAVLSLRQRLVLARQIAEDARHVLDLVRLRRAIGTATDLEVQQQESAVATFDAAIPALRRQAEVAVHALAILTGRAPEGFAVEAETIEGLARPNLRPDLPPALLARRPDIRAAEARLIAANFDIGVARAAFFPSLSLTAGLGVGSKTLSRLSSPTMLTDLGADLLQPLFRGGQLEGQLKFSRQKQIELVAAYRQAVLAALQDVEDALSTLVHADDQEQAESKAVTAAQRAADLARLQYRLGSADYLSVLTTEQTLFQARDALAQLHLLQLQAVVGLCRALGGGFDKADLTAATAPPPRSAGAPS